MLTSSSSQNRTPTEAKLTCRWIVYGEHDPVAAMSSQYRDKTKPWNLIRQILSLRASLTGKVIFVKHMERGELSLGGKSMEALFCSIEEMGISPPSILFSTKLLVVRIHSRLE